MKHSGNARECGFPEGINHCGVIESNWNEIVDIFGYMNLKESLLCICAYGFEKPSAIYSRDIIWLIKTGLTIAKINSGTIRLSGSNLSCLHWWNKCSE
uniref:Uncharacterized protein n=1 Tax=Castor canadensis TaxID=51338 RepID=A0A8C0W7B5_CASCN